MVVDKDAFFRRVRHFYHSWNVRQKSLLFPFIAIYFIELSFVCHQNNEEDLENIHNVDAIVVIVGQDQDVVYSKSTALQVSRHRFTLFMII